MPKVRLPVNRAAVLLSVAVVSSVAALAVEPSSSVVAVYLQKDRREEIVEAAEVRMKYSGYIRREKEIAEKIHRLEDLRIRGRFHYEDIQSLSTEARQKLTKIDPETMAQASRIPGVSPSDINVLLVLMNR